VTLNRRDFVKGVAAVPILSASSISIESSRELVNDDHTGLNPTWVERVVRPTSIIEIQNVIHDCHRQNKVLSVSGSRHAAGGQQFAEGSTLLDMRGSNRVVHLEHAATKRGGSFYLTYNRFAARSELDAAYPQFSDFLMLKKKYDPSEIFQSEWYRYYQQLYK
jgi:FAD/FMN-containing dehydrogenase